MPWAIVKPVVDLRMQFLCRKPYPLHPKGCPNWGAKMGCPPLCRPIGDQINLDREVWAVWTRFDLKQHVDQLRFKHPAWTDRQLKCCLYWQPRARQVLKKEIEAFRVQHPELQIVGTPEGAGVCLTPVMRQIGVELEWPPEHWTYQIILAGSPVFRP